MNEVNQQIGPMGEPYDPTCNLPWVHVVEYLDIIGQIHLLVCKVSTAALPPATVAANRNNHPC